MYQYQFPEVPRLPPETVNVVVAPEQIVAGEEVAEVAIVERVLTVIEVLTHAVVLHDPSALT